MSIDENALKAAADIIKDDFEVGFSCMATARDAIEAYEAAKSQQPVGISDVKPGTLPINIDEALEALHTQYQFCGDAIIARRSPDAPTDIQLGRIRAAHLNIIPILKALKAAISPERESVYDNKDAEAVLKIANAAIKRNGIMKDALNAINAMLGNAIGAGAVRRGDMMSESDSRFFWIFDITKEALSQIEGQS